MTNKPRKVNQYDGQMQREEALNIALSCMEAADREAFPEINEAMATLTKMRDQVAKKKADDRAFRQSIMRAKTQA
jgi:hypothetical protein